MFNVKQWVIFFLYVVDTGLMDLILLSMLPSSGGQKMYIQVGVTACVRLIVTIHYNQLNNFIEVTFLST